MNFYQSTLVFARVIQSFLNINTCQYSGHPTTIQTLDTFAVLFKSFQYIGTPNRGCPILLSETKFVSLELIAANAKAQQLLYKHMTHEIQIERYPKALGISCLTPDYGVELVSTAVRRERVQQYRCNGVATILQFE